MEGNGYLYFSEGGDVETKQIAVDGEKLYISASFAGKVHFETLSLQASLVDISSFMVEDVQHFAIISLSAKDLSQAELVAELKPSATITNDVAHNTFSFSFTEAQGSIFIGAIGCGNLTLATPNASKDFTFFYPGNGITEFGHIIASVNGNGVKTATYSAPKTTTENKKNDRRNPSQRQHPLCGRRIQRHISFRQHSTLHKQNGSLRHRFKQKHIGGHKHMGKWI